jgi:hypothetical protein
VTTAREFVSCKDIDEILIVERDQW